VVRQYKLERLMLLNKIVEEDKEDACDVRSTLPVQSISVMHVGPGYGQRGGIASVLGELAQQEDRFAINHVSFSFFETRSLKSIQGLMLFFFSDLPRFAIALTRNVDIVHFHVSVRGSFYRKYLLYLLARFGGKKTIFHLHAGNFEQFLASAKSVVQSAAGRFIRNADAVIAVSTAIGEELRRLGGGARDLFVIGNTAGALEAAADVRPDDASSSPSADRYVAFAGRLTEAKGVGDVLQAIAALKSQGLFVRLKLAGGGDIAGWKRIAKDYGIDDRVEFAGWLDGEEKVAFYRDAAMFCMPSHFESFGIATLEAMFAGLPVIGTKVGGFLDLVEEDVTGHLADVRDTQALAGFIRKLAEDPVAARQMGEAGLLRARERYSANSVVDQYVRCYREVMTGSGSAT
jgi:glycosyltransferase involved in cell wall biosynthesis